MAKVEGFRIIRYSIKDPYISRTDREQMIKSNSDITNKIIDNLFEVKILKKSVIQINVALKIGEKIKSVEIKGKQPNIRLNTQGKFSDSSEQKPGFDPNGGLIWVDPVRNSQTFESIIIITIEKGDGSEALIKMTSSLTKPSDEQGPDYRQFTTFL